MSTSSSSQQPPFWELNLETHKSSLTAFCQQHVRTLNIVSDGSLQSLLCRNLLRSVEQLRVVEQQPSNNNNNNKESNNHNDDNDDDDDEPSQKKRRLEVPPRVLEDPYHVWFQKASDNNNTNKNNAVWDERQDDLPETDGGKLCVLSVNGILNGMVALSLADSVHTPAKTIFKNAIQTGTNKIIQQTFGSQVTILQLHALANGLHGAIAKQVKSDILRTTPQRIVQLLAPDLTTAEFASIRKRVYDTVILGKGLAKDSNGDDMMDDQLATAASAGVHEVEKYKKCPNPQCGNNEQSDFILDRKNGDVICQHCGTVVSESIMHEGSQFRKFEGEEDRNHHGDQANPLYSNAHNMGTSLSGVAPSTGAGIGGYGANTGGGGRNLETILKNAHAYTEMNVSQFGKTDRRTRTGYKDRQKKEAFVQMTHAGDSLNLHEAVVQRAKELFAGFRDDRELVQQFKGVLAACLCESFEQLSAEGKLILKQQQQQQDQQYQQQQSSTGGSSGDGNTKTIVSSRAARRNELHHATLAGKGGLLLNDERNGKKQDDDADKDDASTKPAAKWDLEDCRTWLLEASRRIAVHWMEEKKKNTPASQALPSGPQGELEGLLVEHSIRLCETLEEELQSRSKVNGRGRVHTPRVTDMSKLGIKWQHSHERGSGGKGGVGGSGTTAAKATGSKRTAGQILMLKTAKKLGDILQNKVAGEAFHRELRVVISKEEARKRKEMREEASRQRFVQMKRKPWLQARVQKGETQS